MADGAFLSSPRRPRAAMPALLLAGLAALALGVAYGSQHLGGLAPCQMCLWQRFPYWAAIGLGLGALALPRLARAMIAVGVLLLLGNAVLAGFHAGVEWGWWPSPFPGCAAPAGPATRSVDDMLRTMAAAPTVRCDEAALRVLGLSMAGWNAIYALVVAASVTTFWPRRSR